jgi:hypothetical protein
MAGIAVAQSGTRARHPKVLESILIKPRLGGGHSLTHSYTHYQHEPDVHEFSDSEGEKAMKHIAKHAGLPYPKIGEEEGDEPEPVHGDQQDRI